MSEPIPGLPEGLVLTLRQTLPDFTLVGALARDYHLHTLAGLPAGSANQGCRRRNPGALAGCLP